MVKKTFSTSGIPHSAEGYYSHNDKTVENQPRVHKKIIGKLIFKKLLR